MAKKAASKSPGKAVPRDQGNAVELLKELRLINVRLLDIGAHLEIRNNELPEEVGLSSQVAAGMSEDGFLNVDGIVTVTSKRKEGEDDEIANAKSAVWIQVHCQCVFQPKSDNESLQKLIKAHMDELAKSGMAIMWPQFREIVQSISSRMGLSPFILPMVMSGHVAAEKEKGDLKKGAQVKKRRK